MSDSKFPGLDGITMPANWFEGDRCAMSVIAYAGWPYRFAIGADTELVTPELIGEIGEQIIDALAAVCERQRQRLAGADYSIGSEPFERMNFRSDSGMAAIRFDPRAIEPRDIRTRAPLILRVLKDEVQLAQEAAE